MKSCILSHIKNWITGTKMNVLISVKKHILIPVIWNVGSLSARL